MNVEDNDTTLLLQLLLTALSVLIHRKDLQSPAGNPEVLLHYTNLETGRFPCRSLLMSWLELYLNLRSKLNSGRN
jgi:hypothetical protein